MKAWRKVSWGLVLQGAVFLLFVSAGALVSGIFWTSPVAPRAKTLTILPEDLTLGRVWQQPEFKFSIPVRNRSAQTVTVENVSATCNCTSISPDSFQIPPGGRVALNGTIDLMRSIEDPLDHEQVFEVGVILTLGSPTRETLGWPIRGTCVRALAITLPVIRLVGANEVVFGAAGPTIELKIDPLVEVAQLKAEWNGAAGDVVLSRPDADGSYTLRFTPSRHLPRGPVDTRISLRTFLHDGARGPEVEVPIKGQVVGPVGLSPRRVTLRYSPDGGHAASSSSGSATVRIVPRDDRKWSIGSIDSTPDGVAVEKISSSHIRVSTAPGCGRSDDGPLFLTLTSDSGITEECAVHVTLLPRASH